MAPAAPPAGKKFSALFIVIPVIAGVVGVAVWLETKRSELEAAQQGKGGEALLGVLDAPEGFTRERRSRELREAEAPRPPPAVSEEDELTGLKKKKPPPPKVYPPAEKAWRSVKASFDKLESRNESTARKYRIKILAMRDRKDSAPEASFIKEAAALEQTLKTELAKPENQ